MVPPPPISTLPNSATSYFILASSKIWRICATNSALASDAPDLPLAPVYLFSPIPLPKYPELFFS